MVELELIKLEWVRHRCAARFRRAENLPMHSRGCWVQVGVLLDGSGRWYVDTVHPVYPDICRPYPDEKAAWAEARRWMGQVGGDWEQVPCNPTTGWEPGERGRADPRRDQPSAGGDG